MLTARLFHRALVTIPLTFFATHAVAANMSEGTGGAPTASALHFDGYDCSGDSTNVQTRHIGQVIANVYQEWVESYTAVADGRSIHCVSTLRPTAGSLTQAQAQDLLAKSRNMTVATSSSGEKKAAASSATSSVPGALLPIGVDSSANATASQDSGLATTPMQPLSAMASSSQNNAVLDLGFPKAAPASNEKASAAAKEKPATIGTDDRVRVGDFNSSPWYLIGQLIVTWKDGTQSTCTGTLVSQYVVLTAGQCAHNRDKGGFAARATFAPGQTQAAANATIAQPFGVRAADFVESNSRWTQISGGETIQTLDAHSDFAAYYFAEPWTHVATFMPIVYGDTSNGAMNSAGYPTDVGTGNGVNQGLWYGSGIETTRSKNVLRAFQVREFSLDVSAGDNGGPFWIFDGSQRSLVGIVSYGGDEVAGGVWFGGDNQAVVTALASWAPSQSAPNHTAENLRVPFVYPSNYAGGQGYFRFYNPSPQAGTVTVTVANGTTGQVLGTWTSASIPAFASIQVGVSDVESHASPGILPAGKDRYALEVSSNFTGYFQYILYNAGSGWITNISGCSNGLSSDVVHLNNVHTSIVKDFPSAIVVHNLASKSASSIVGVYNAITGVRLGGIIIPDVPANADAVFSIKDAEAVLSLHPAPSDGHYNLVMESDFQGYLQHILYNSSGVISNMTAKCVMPIH